MVDAFTRHSSGSHGWSEVRRLKIRARRDLPHFGAQRVEHQIAGRSEHTTDVCNLKTLAFHLQISNHCDSRKAEFSATVRNNLERHRVVSLGCINDVSAETCQTLISNCRRVDRCGQIVWTGNVKIRTGELG